jgi:hypothetical protein
MDALLEVLASVQQRVLAGGQQGLEALDTVRNAFVVYDTKMRAKIHCLCQIKLRARNVAEAQAAAAKRLSDRDEQEMNDLSLRFVFLFLLRHFLARLSLSHSSLSSFDDVGRKRERDVMHFKQAVFDVRREA